MNWAHTTTDGCRLLIRVTPRSSRNHVDGPVGDALKIRLNAPPVEGKANALLIEFLADQLQVARRSVSLEAGAQGRLKRVHVTGLDAATVCQRLQPQLAPIPTGPASRTQSHPRRC
jgi:uncharacterized protein (TIGR00251 family)